MLSFNDVRLYLSLYLPNIQPTNPTTNIETMTFTDYHHFGYMIT